LFWNEPASGKPAIRLPFRRWSHASQHRLLLWIWKYAPFPLWLRHAYVDLTNPHFLVGVVAYIENERGEVLLFHHTYRRVHTWSLPGGYLKAGESPHQGIAREVLEESGLRIATADVLAAAFHTAGQLDLLIRCRVEPGTPTATPEVDNWKYVSQTELQRVLPNHALLLQHAGLMNRKPTPSDH
jgi:8-oxo-dGTP diphosphatase